MPEIHHPVHLVAKILIIVGALNWLSVGLYQYNFVDVLAKNYSKYVYILVGLAGVFEAVHLGLWVSGVTPKTLTHTTL